MTCTTKEIRERFRAFRRPGIGRLPLVTAHGVIPDFGCLCQQTVVFALEKVVEPSIRKGVVIKSCVAQVSLPDDRVF